MFDIDKIEPLFKVYEVKLWDYAVVDTYGGMMSATASDTKEGCLAKYQKLYPDMPVEQLHCAVIRVVPMFVSGDESHHFNQKPHFDYLHKQRAD